MRGRGEAATLSGFNVCVHISRAHKFSCHIKPKVLESSGSSFKYAVIEQIRFMNCGYELITSAVG